MKWINAEQQVTVTIYDEEHEEYIDKIMTVEEMLDAYTNEGCPTIYTNPEREDGEEMKRNERKKEKFRQAYEMAIEALKAQPEDHTELKQEFLRMASYIDVLLECSDEQKDTLLGFISRLAEFMPWTERY